MRVFLKLCLQARVGILKLVQNICDLKINLNAVEREREKDDPLRRAAVVLGAADVSLKGSLPVWFWCPGL